MANYKFYMQGVEWNGDTKRFEEKEDTFVDLENDFQGLKYAKCEGLNSIGERVVYVEDYADDNRRRVYMSDEPIHKPIDVKLTLYFFGDDRQYKFDVFNSYIMDGYHAYWDTARRKKVIFYIGKSVTPSKDIFIGGKPYIEVTYTLNCVYGKAINV